MRHEHDEELEICDNAPFPARPKFLKTLATHANLKGPSSTPTHFLREFPPPLGIICTVTLKKNWEKYEIMKWQQV